MSPLQGHQVESQTFASLDPLVLCMLLLHLLPCCHQPKLPHGYPCILHNNTKPVKIYKIEPQEK